MILSHRKRSLMIVLWFGMILLSILACTLQVTPTPTPRPTRTPRPSPTPSLPDLILGSWQAEQDGIVMVFTFSTGGEMMIFVEASFLGATYTWVDKNRIEIVMNISGESESILGEVEISGNTLRFTADGETIEFIKVEE